MEKQPVPTAIAAPPPAPQDGDKPSFIKNYTKEAGGFAVAELSGVAAASAVMSQKERLIGTGPIKAATQWLEHSLVAPNLGAFEKGISKIQVHGFQADAALPAATRAHNLAETIAVYSMAFLAEVGAKLYMRRAANSALGVEEEKRPKATTWGQWFKNLVPSWRETNVIAADELFHYAFVGANAIPAYGRMSDKLINGLTPTVQKFSGMSANAAKEFSSGWIVWQLPNLIGLGAGLSTIALTADYKHAQPHGETPGTVVDTHSVAKAKAAEVQPSV